MCLVFHPGLEYSPTNKLVNDKIKQWHENGKLWK